MLDKRKKNTEFFNQVRNYLLEKGYKPGDRVEAEISLAKRFFVSRYKIRTALSTLTELGILERTPRRGTIVKSFDADSLSEQIKFQFNLALFNIAEFKEARCVVEHAIMPLVVRRITPQQIAELEDTIQQMIRNADNPKLADKSDRDFHLLLFSACGNNVLQAFSGVISTLFHSEGYRHRYWQPSKIRRLAKEHALILEAVKKGDCALAIRRMEDHLGSVDLGVLTY
jgi:DNA-binding FadR family transcriptional regulator